MVRGARSTMVPVVSRGTAQNDAVDDAECAEAGSVPVSRTRAAGDPQKASSHTHDRGGDPHESPNQDAQDSQDALGAQAVELQMAHRQGPARYASANQTIDHGPATEPQRAFKLLGHRMFGGFLSSTHHKE
jgi:hypothetical protein